RARRAHSGGELYRRGRSHLAAVRRRLERRSAEPARDAARAAAAATIDVLSGVNQALRTPLSGILDAAARLSTRYATDESGLEEVDRIAAAAAALLTRLDALVAVAGPRAAGADARRASHPADGPHPGSRVLIVDDHRVNRELARAMLAPWDLRITEAEDGRAAIAAARAEPFDLILMDVRMPGLDGPGAMVQIRQGDGPNRDTAILAFSADADDDSLHGLVDRGFDGIVSKPILAAELVAAVARWTNAPRPQAEDERQIA
ncbi:MAG: response regulator, partial [Pseudomonadota bacterium]